jgi:hypothetical protein
LIRSTDSFFPMPIFLPAGRPTLLIRKPAFERSGITRHALDERLGLTADEFRVENELVCLGPIAEEDAMQAVIAELEGAGLTYFEDFFELSGNWPEWLAIHVMGLRGSA